MYSQSIVNFDYADESNFEKEMIMNKLAKLIAGVENRIQNRVNHFSSIHQECETENRNLINDGYEFSIARTLLEKHQQAMKDKIVKTKNELIAFQNDCVAYIENPLFHPVKQQKKDDRIPLSLDEAAKMNYHDFSNALVGKSAKYRFDLIASKKIVKFFGYTIGGKNNVEYSDDFLYNVENFKEYDIIPAIRLVKEKYLKASFIEKIFDNFNSIKNS
jgi:hypothetical protein